MIFDLKLLNTVFALICSLGIFTIIQVVKSNLENGKIERFCSDILESLLALKRASFREPLQGRAIADLDDELSGQVRLLQAAYRKDIEAKPELRATLLDVVNARAGKTYSLYDLHEAFEGDTVTPMLLDVASAGRYLFSNVVYIVELEAHGFCDLALRYRKESGIL